MWLYSMRLHLDREAKTDGVATALYILTLGCIGLIPTPAKVTIASKDV